MVFTADNFHAYELVDLAPHVRPRGEGQIEMQRNEVYGVSIDVSGGVNAQVNTGNESGYI